MTWALAAEVHSYLGEGAMDVDSSRISGPLARCHCETDKKDRSKIPVAPSPSILGHPQREEDLSSFEGYSASA